MTRIRWLIAGFAVYLALLAWIVLWKLEPPYVGEGGLRHVKLVPFVRTAEDGASAPAEVLANLLLFVPFGLYLGLLRPLAPWWRLAGVFAASSLLLEAAQYLLSIGSTDLTDVIVNTAGGLAGLGLSALARRSFRERAGIVMARVCAVVTVSLLVASAAFIASPMHYAPLRDVRVPLDSAPDGRGPHH
ncbi:VanZ family protein [Agromyces salentinus]|uniref:VanZ-like domain-containing protein n=1 Tax=Agromyces salentinus TaxID=269421 RepID=A0ABN2MF45_9MICO|nr:VanZ family protein [Agromyces salentinus]